MRHDTVVSAVLGGLLGRALWDESDEYRRFLWLRLGPVPLAALPAPRRERGAASPSHTFSSQRTFPA